jgi:hypothetical protein
VLEDSGSLLPLALAHVHKTLALPSWVPDWSHLPVSPNLAKTRLQLHDTYNAAGNSSADVEIVTSSVLMARGISVDTVKSRTHSPATLTSIDSHIRLLKNWYNFATGAAQDSLQQILKHNVFAEVMMAGCMMDEAGGRALSAPNISTVANRLTTLQWGDILRSPVLRSHEAAVTSRTLFASGSGYLGMGPQTIQEGDVVCVQTRTPRTCSLGSLMCMV